MNTDKTINTSATLLLISTVGFSTFAHAQAVSESREWIDTYPVSGNNAHLQVSNIWGNVEVRGGEVGKIVVSVKEKRSAPNQKLFERSLEVLNLRTDQDSDGVAIVVGQQWRNWQQHQSCRDCRVEYQFEVQVPTGSSIDVSTVNDGKIDIRGVSGQISASNVNGPVYVSGARHCRSLSNINGVVDLNFSAQPEDDCDIETINGDINLSMPASAGLNLALDQSHGTVMSEFPVDTYSLPANVEHLEKDGVNRYHIQQSAGLRLAGGGHTFTISSMNGDVRIQKTK